VVQEYESNPLAEARAERKVKATKRTEIKKYS